jgi:uncharacterized protein DUF6636
VKGKVIGLVVLGLFGSSAAIAASSGAFRTPSGNIVCAYSFDSSPAYVSCGIKSGLKPRPSRAIERDCRFLGYQGNRIDLQSPGRAQPVPCAGDTGPFAYVNTKHVLAYGETLHGGGIRCTSRRAGLTCRNVQGHGFFMSRERWRVF